MANLVKVGAITINLDLVTQVQERNEDSTHILFVGGTSTALAGPASAAFRHYLSSLVIDLEIVPQQPSGEKIDSNVDEGGPDVDDERMWDTRI
ncbi:hypothetical protein P12x_003031 [Tundrisphaera lichenicola]|uniref:hypothetical protein n=1 Tax=Tundrisphaera lichenicola TaxID=2029860 RepID=UPI003EC012EA